MPGRPGSEVPFTLDGEVGVFDGLLVAGGAVDAEPEQVAEAAYVATGGVDLVEDPVLAKAPGGGWWFPSTANCGRPGRAVARCAG